MATAEQLKSLIRSYFSDDLERFTTVVLQVAAHEAQQGHGALAHEIREIVEKARRERGHVKLLKFPQDLRGLVLSKEPSITNSSLVLPDALKSRINRIVHEYRQQQKLKSHGLSNRRKILLVGPPGTGKTMTAQVLAHELRLKLLTIQVDKLVTKFPQDWRKSRDVVWQGLPSLVRPTTRERAPACNCWPEGVDAHDA